MNSSYIIGAMRKRIEALGALPVVNSTNVTAAALNQSAIGQNQNSPISFGSVAIFMLVGAMTVSICVLAICIGIKEKSARKTTQQHTSHKFRRPLNIHALKHDGQPFNDVSLDEFYGEAPTPENKDHRGIELSGMRNG